MTRPMQSPYLEWAKRHSVARWNLASSGVPHLSIDEIGGWPPAAALTAANGYGYEPLLERIAAHHRVHPTQVVTANGCSMANYLALAALIEPGDEVLIERPTYDPLLQAAGHLGARVVRFERRAEDGFAVDPEAVEAAITDRTRVIVLANLHNPSSQHTPNAVLTQIGAAAEKVGARVIVDEVYLDTVFDQPPGSCVHLGPAFIATGSLTKAYGLSGLRCGWVIADEALARRIWSLVDLHGNVQAPAMDVLAAAAFDRLPALAARSRALLDTNHRTFAAWLAANDTIACTLPRWGTTVFAIPTRQAHLDGSLLCHVAHADYDVAIVPGVFFERPDYFRLSLSTDTATLEEGLRRLGRALTPAWNGESG